MKDIHRHIRFSVILGLIISLAGYFGAKFISAVLEYRDVEYTALDLVFPITITLILSFVIYFLLDIKIKWKESKNFNLKRWHIFLPLILISTALLILLFPGFFAFDATMMYESYLFNDWTNHFTPFVCIIIGAIISFGKMIYSANVGHAILVIIQFTFVNIALTETIYYCSKKLNKKSFGIISTIFFIFHPLVQILLIRTGQDTFFAGLFLLICLEFVKIAEDSNYFNNKRTFYLFILVFLLCITRNNGLYAIIPSLIASIFILKDKTIRKKFLITLSIPLLLFVGYQNIIINNLVRHKDPFYKEMINVPLMQMARAAYHTKDNDTLAEIKQYFNDGCKDWRYNDLDWNSYLYSSGIADQYKDCLKFDEVNKNPLRFIKLWVKLGISKPVEYIEAPLIFMLGMYYPFLPYEPHGKIFYQWHLYIDSYTSDYYYYGVDTKHFTQPAKDIADLLYYQQKWSKIPVLNQLWRAPFTFFLCLITTFYVLYRRNYKYILPMSLIIGLIATVFLSPVLLFRYLFPAVLCTPIMIYIFKKTVVK